MLPRTRSGAETNAGPSLALGGVVVMLLVVGVAIGLGFGPVMALAPSPDTEDGGWATVESIETAATDERTVQATITYRTGGPNGTAIDQFSVSPLPSGQVDAAGKWAYVPKSSLPPSLASANGNHSAGVQFLGPWALVGNLSSATERVRTADVTVVAPTAMDVDPSRKAHFLSTFVSPYQLHPNRATPATIAIAPNTLPSDGLTYGTTGYVTQHAFWDGKATSVWIHEYLHTQQTFATAPEMAWFREASATYFSARMLEAQYYEVGEPAVREWIAARDDFEEVVLANEATWGHSNADYYRGARLLYAVDAAIRAGSDGEHTLVDVFREMNAREDPVTIEAFVRMVESKSGDPQPWLRQAITEPGPMDAKVPPAGDVFTATETGG